MKNENRKGFTLVELLAVIAIIAILGITAVAAYNGITQRTKEKAYEAKIKQIENAAAKWASENNVSYKTEISVNKLIVQGYLQADSVSDEGKALISNPVDNSNMVCYVIDLSRKEGEYEAVVSKTKQNCSLAEQALYDEKIKVAAYTDTNKKVEFNDNYLTWTNRDISLIVSSEDFDSSAVSISYDFEGNTVTKNVSGLERSTDQYQADDSKYYNVFNISAEIILNSNVVITYTLNDGSIYSRIVNVRIDKECATFIASSTNDWISVEKPLTVFIDDGEGSGVKGFYISKDIANKGDIILTSYKEDVDIKEVGTYYIWTEDMAGNISLAEDSKIIVNNIDTSEPTCEISFIGTLGQHGWYLTDVIPRATTSEAGISGLYFGISKTNTPVYPEYVSGGFVGTVDATLQNQTEKAGVNYYCFVKSLAGREGTNTKTAKVDKTRPTLKVEPTSNNENTIEKNVKISIADALSGLNADNKIYYAWSLDNVNPPTTWEYIEAKATDESNAAKAVSMTGKEKVGEYYLWIKGATITDYAGNSSDEENKVYGPYAYSATVTYDGNGNTSGSTTSTICPYNKPCTLATNGFKKTGYTYSGWFTAKVGGTKYGTTHTFLDNTVVYAQWTPITYTIKFDGNGSTSGSTTSVTCTYDSSCTLTKNGFAKTGYTFAGWAKSASGSVEYSNGKSVKNLTSINGDTVTLYAKWTPITYTIKFDGNGSTGGSTTSVTCTYDSSCTLTKNGFTKTGYTFAGWNTLSIGKGTSYNNSASVKNLSSKSGDTVTLYAKWTANTYTIKFDGNGSTSGSTDSKTCTYDKDCALPSNGFKKTGYTFAGWNTLANGKGTSYTNGASVKNLSNASGGTATLYAQWTANTYTISYDSYVGTVATKPTTGTYGTQLTISKPTKNIVVSFNGNSQGATISSTSSITKAYTFNGWTSSSGDGLESTALYGSSSATSAWSGSSTKYSYFKNLRSTSGTVKMTSNWTAPTITLPTVTKTGYTCVWNSSSDGKGSLTVASGKTYTPTTAETRTFYAYCTAISYKISYSYGYGSAGTNAPTSGTYGSNVSISKPTKSVVLTFDRNSQGATISSTANVSGTSTFSGWTSSSSDGLASTALAGGSSWSGTATKATTFKNLSYTSGATVKLTATWDNPELTLPTIKKTGYTCSWNTSADGTGTKKASGATYTATRTRTWYAYCTPKTYTIAYDSHVGTVATKPTSGTYDSDVTISNPTKTLTITFDMGDTGIAQKSAVSGNYTFNGWTSSSDDGLNTSTAKTGSSSATSAWSGSKTKNTHFKNLRSTSGTVTMTSNWTAPSVKLPTLKKTGYTCTWNWIKSNGTTKSYASGGTYTASTATSRTLVAKCTVNCSEDNPTGCKVYYTCRQGNTFMYQSASSSAQAVTVASGTPLYKISESGNWTYFYTESLSSTNPWYVDVKGGQNYGWIYNACLTDQSADYCEFVQCPDL